jgi:DNA-binding LytR/AlgR family response regulator
VPLETALPDESHAPRFFDRLVRLRGLSPEQLVAVEAEDHYIQVHSTRGKELIYYCFGDALGDLHALQGVQIHRSVSVSRAGIARLEGSGRNLQVVLVTGDTLRVSHSNRGVLRNAGWVN